MKARTEIPTPEERRRIELLYPGEVEDSMPEGERSFSLTLYLVLTLRRWIVDPSHDSAHGNMPIYFVEGDPGRHVSPDAFLLRGVPFDPLRVSYRLWETGIVPSVVFEIVSKGYEKKDAVVNRRRYRQLGVPEYYWFDWNRRTLTALQLDREGRRYIPMRPNAAGRFVSAELGLEVGIEGDVLGLYRDGVYILPPDELLAETESQLAEKESLLAEKENQLERKDELLAEKDERIQALEREIERLRRGT